MVVGTYDLHLVPIDLCAMSTAEYIVPMRLIIVRHVYPALINIICINVTLFLINTVQAGSKVISHHPIGRCSHFFKLHHEFDISSP